MTQAEQAKTDTAVRRSRSLAMLSHDLRSALVGVIGSLNQIGTSSNSNDVAAHRDAALIAAMDATQLLDGILDIEAIETAEFELNVSSVNTTDLLADLSTRWTDRAGDCGIKLNIVAKGAVPPMVEVDRHRLSRVLGNVIENAIKHTPKGCVTVEFSLEGENMLNFVIRDEGPGFSPDATDLLFDFGGRPNNASHSGSGLGLYIAKSLMDQMGGEISVHNEGGAVVTLSLPVVHHGSARPLSSLAVLPVSDLPDLSHLNILLAEDNATNQMVVTQMLSAMGAKASVASDGVEAVEMFNAQQFDLILLDIEMPRLSGIDVIKHIRHGAYAPNIPIIALTAYAMREHRERISEAGANGMIAKPILGIDAFGKDILALTRRAGVATPSEAPLDGAVDTATFAALEQSVGSNAMGELIRQVQIDLNNVRDGLAQPAETEGHESVRRASHVLISVAGAIGARGTQSSAEALNRAAHCDDLTAVNAGIAECLTGIDEIHRFLDGRNP